jgi:hypothetical protein
VVNEVYRVIVGKSGHPGQFLYIDCWQDGVPSQLTWLRPCLQETCRIMVAKVATTPKCRERTKEPVLAEEPKEVPLPCVPLYPPLPPAPSSTPSPSTSDGETQGTNTPLKPDPEALGILTPPTSLGPTDPKSTPSLPFLTPHSSFNWGYPTGPREDPFTPQTLTTLQMPLKEAKAQYIMTSMVKYKEEGEHSLTSPLPLQIS